MSSWQCIVIEWNQDKMADAEKIKIAFSNSEKIGVIGSPSSSNDLTLDILGTAVEKQLVGNLSIFNYKQENKEQYALGQITEITMSNPMTQDTTVKSIIRYKSDGRVDPLTERQDTHVAKMMLSSVFGVNSNQIEQSMLGTVPATGTLIKLLGNEMLNSLLADYQSDLFYLGRIYGANVLLPMWFKHFGSGKGGIDEAYHMGIFGKTGSGKTKLALMMMLGYAKHKKMSIFVLDPQNQFATEFKEGEAKEILEKMNRKAEVISLQDLVLSGSELFKKILIRSGFLVRRCRIISEDNQVRAAEQIDTILKRRVGQTQIDQPTGKIPPWDFYKKTSFDLVWNTILTDNQAQRGIYSGQEYRNSMITAMQSQDNKEVYEEWKKITNLFSYRNRGETKKISDLIKEITNSKDEEGKILIIDLSEFNAPDDVYWNDEMKHVVISQFISNLTKEAENHYRANGKLLNTLVIMDEAHRLAPKDESIKNDFQKEVKALLIDAVRTTRKYGLGWTFISQTLSSLDKEIINQLRIYIFGFGLAWGIERKSLMELIGGIDQASKLYQLFNDPQSSLKSKQYPFMSIGPISPLSFSGTPLFFTSLKYPDDFKKINGM